MSNFIASQRNPYDSLTRTHIGNLNKEPAFKPNTTVQPNKLFRENSKQITGRKVKFKNV